MKTKTFLVGSLTVNAITLVSLIFLLKIFSALPNTTPAQVKWMFVTNTPPTAIEKSTNEEAPPSP